MGSRIFAVIHDTAHVPSVGLGVAHSWRIFVHSATLVWSKKNGEGISKLAIVTCYVATGRLCAISKLLCLWRMTMSPWRQNTVSVSSSFANLNWGLGMPPHLLETCLYSRMTDFEWLKRVRLQCCVQCPQNKNLSNAFTDKRNVLNVFKL